MTLRVIASCVNDASAERRRVGGLEFGIGTILGRGMAVRGGVIVLVEPFGTGGGVDVIARPFAAALAAALAAQVVVDNRPGLGSTAAPAFVASAPADGRTLLMNTSAHAYTAALSERLPYDPVADFVPVAAVTSQAYVLVAHPRAGLRRPADLARAGRTRPGALSFVSAGVGTGTHVCAAQLNSDLGIGARHIPARAEDGISETIARVAAGEADYSVSPIPIAAPHLAAGTLVAIGVTAARRSPLLPDVPTLAEAGAEGFEFSHLVRAVGTRRNPRAGGFGARSGGVRSAAIAAAGVAL